jgi:RNA polymerase sigma-70 factor (ECF subfamily)
VSDREGVDVELVPSLALDGYGGAAVPDRAALAHLPGVSAVAEQEFAELYEREFPKLAGYLTALTGDVEVAREATQEAFTRLFARWRRVQEPRGFVYVVGTNLCKHHWRQGGRERSAVTSLGITTQHGRSAHDPWLRDLVDRLPGHLREAVLLHYYADLPVAEVAAALRRPVGTVKRRLHEARALLSDAVLASERGSA